MPSLHAGQLALAEPPIEAPVPIRSDLVIVSNRLPMRRIRRGGREVWDTSPGGLVSALRPILRERESTWVGWLGQGGAARRPFTHDHIHSVPVGLDDHDIELFYEGFSNRTLWPLYHDAVRPPEYERRWWRRYVEVNARFARAAAMQAADGGAVWVHDYQLQLVPAMLRELRPDLRIGFFLHIPFPPHELFAQLPWRGEIIRGLLGADVVGFQTTFGARNFARLARRYAGAAGRSTMLRHDGRMVRVDGFPISIDVEQIERLAAEEDVHRRTEAYREQLGAHRRILLGVDRLDYTKGIDIRLKAYHELLKSGRLSPRECVMVQVAVPSRQGVEEYQELRAAVERQVGEINGEFGELGSAAVHYLHRSLPLDELVALYRAADVMLITPFRDGMNLVAKEYCAARTDLRGALVLSEFTGAARELRAALQINPHDLDGMESTIERAVHMPPAEQARRMRTLRSVIRHHDVHDWARSFFKALTA